LQTLVAAEFPIQQIVADGDVLQHNRDQNKYSAIQNEYAKLISGTIAKTQLDIARIDDRWEKQRQEQAKHEKQVELFNLQLKRAKESERQSKE
jgi:hypothetical protein